MMRRLRWEWESRLDRQHSAVEWIRRTRPRTRNSLARNCRPRSAGCCSAGSDNYRNVGVDTDDETTLLKVVEVVTITDWMQDGDVGDD
jgi:hypothetical protein